MNKGGNRLAFDFARDQLTPAWIDRPWGRMCVRTGGQGPPILALHGLGNSGRYWDGLVSAVDGGRTVVAPDLAGFGQSAKPRIAYDDLALHLTDLDAIAAGFEELSVVGFSLGGLIAAAWAARNAPRVTRLALVAVPFPSSSIGTPGLLARADARQYAAAPQRWLYAAQLLLWTLAFSLPLRTTVFPRAVLRDYARHTLYSYWSNARLAWDASVADQLQGLSGLSGRQLLLYGALDPRVSLASADRYAQLLPAAELRVLPDAGHQLLLETGFAALADWLLGSCAAGSA